MSGSSGGGPIRSTGGSFGGGQDDCDISEQTVLNSPVPSVIGSLAIGEELTVHFEPGPPQRLVAQNNATQVAGSITSPAMVRLIACIQKGNEYVALVMKLSGGACTIDIRRK